MNPKQKVRLATAKLSSEMQSEVDKLQSVFILYQEYIEKRDKSGELQEKSIESSIKARVKGNNLLKLKDHNHLIHHSILRWYTQSITLAPQGTKELVFGYGNRSALLMHLQHYREALVDIDRALQLTQDDVYKTKLLARKERCLGLLKEQNLIKSTKYLSLAENKVLEKLRSKLVENFKPSATVPSASDGVGLAYNSQLGRHLVATRDIEPGEIVIIEKSYVGTPILHRSQNICSYCVQYAWNGIPCEKCTFVIYCSETCKQEAFKEYHDIECPILKYMWSTDISNEMQAFHRITSLRILIKALKEEGFQSVMKEISGKTSKDNLDGLLSNGILRSDRFKSCYNLMADSKDNNLEIHVIQILYLLIERTDFLTTLIGKNPLTDKIAMSMALPAFYDRDSMTVNPVLLLKLKEALMKLISITQTNSYDVETQMWQCGQCNDPNEHEKKCRFSRGCVVVPTCSLINHRCIRNVGHMCVEKSKIIVYSLCPIKKGEMLCSSYRSVSIFNGNVKTRQQLLQFVCKCKACVDGISMETVMKDFAKDSRIITAVVKKKVSASMFKLYHEDPFESLETSEKIFLDIIKLSELVHKNLNYYKAFIHSAKCHDYIQKIMTKLYQEEMYMPNEC